MKILKKYSEYFITFFFSFILITLIFILSGVKFGNKSLLFSDAIAQYYPLLLFLKNISLYTFKIAGGVGTINTIAYYLISPINIIIFLVNNLQDAIGMIIIFKFSLAALAMYIYLNNIFPQENKYFKFLFSISYMLCSWATKYYFSFIWFDAFYMLPIIALGIDNIIKNKTSLIYLISLFIALICNYYMGYMLCLFSVIYFVYKVSSIDNKKQAIKKFIICSLLSILLASFILYPVLVSIGSINRFDTNTISLGFNNINVLKGIFFGNNDYSLQTFTCAYLYTGVLNIVLLVAYFLNKEISTHDKRLTVLILILLFMSVIFKPLYYMWHGFSTPFGLPARFTFIISFFIILISYKSFISIKKTNPLLFFILLILNIICYLFTGSILLFIANLGLSFLYTIIILLSEKKHTYLYLIFIICLFELVGSAFLCFRYPLVESTKYDTINNYKYFMNNFDDNSFYRIAQSESIFGLDGILSNGNDSEYYLSTNTNNLRIVMSKLELDYNTNYYSYSNSTSEFVDLLLSNKYILKKDNYSCYEQLGTYDLVHENGDIDNLLILKNNNTYGIATMTPNDVLNVNNSDGLDYQNILFKNMTDLKDNLYDEVTSKDGIYNVNSDYYILFISDKPTENSFAFKFYQNGNYIDKYNMSEIHKKILVHLPYISSFSYKINSENDYGIHMKVYKINHNVFNTGVNILKNNAMKNTIYHDGYVKGNVSVKDNHILFTSIPYEQGWTAYVDGEKSNIIDLSDGFIGINLNSGEHTIEFKYKTPGLKTGIIISIISLICVIYFVRKEII